MLNAKTARKSSVEANKLLECFELNRVMSRIESATKIGNFEVTTLDLDEKTEKLLKKNGFKVSHRKNGFQISW